MHQGPANHGAGPCCANPVVLHPVTPLVDCVARGKAFARSADFIQGLLDRLSARLLGQAGIVGIGDMLIDGKLTIEIATTDLEATEKLVPADARVIGGIPIVLKQSGAIVPYEVEDED